MSRQKKKPFTQRNPDVLCSSDRCAEVNGREGVTRQPIKQNVIDRAPEGTDKFLCYYCELNAKNPNNPIRTKKEVKALRAKSNQSRVVKEPEMMTAETT